MLKVNRSLKSLYLDVSECGGTEGSKALAKALEVNHTLTTVSGLKNLGAEGGKALAKALKVNRTLQELSLSNSSLGEEGGMALAGALEENNTLTKLSLGWNNLGVKGGKALAKALMVNRTLKVLKLPNNGLGAEGFKAFVEVLKVNRTLELDLFEHHINDALWEQLSEVNKRNKELAKKQKEEGSAQQQQQASKTDEEKEPLAAQQQSAPRAARSLRPPSAAAAAASAAASAPSAARSLLPPASAAAAAASKPASQPLPQPLALPAKEVESAYGNASAAQDPKTLQALKQLPQQQQLAANVEQIVAAAQVLQVIDVASLKTLEGQAVKLESMFVREGQHAAQDAQMLAIENDPHLLDYYHYFIRALTGTWLACQTINSGMVANNEKHKADYVADGLKQVGQHIPGISMGTSIIAGLISSWTFVEKKKFVQRMAMLFTDLQTAYQQLNALSRQLTLEQKDELEKIAKQPLSLFEKAKTKILIRDVKTYVQIKAVQDCQKLVDAIKADAIPQNPSLADLSFPILGRMILIQQVAVAVSPLSAAAAAAQPQPASNGLAQNQPDVNFAEEFRLMKEREKQREAADKKRETELEELREQQRILQRQNKELQVKVKSLDEQSGGGGGQVFANPSAARANVAESPEFLRLEEKLDVVYDAVIKGTKSNPNSDSHDQTKLAKAKKDLFGSNKK